MGISRRKVLQSAAAVAGLAAAGTPGLVLSQNQPLKIGVSLGLSGAGANVGDALLKGTQIAAMHYNKAGGLLGRQIELVVRDDKFSGAGSVAAVRELAGSGMNLIIGGSQTVTGLALMPLLEEMKIVLLIPSAAGMAITHESFSRNAFRTVSNVYVQYTALGRATAENSPNVMKWQALVPDSSYGRDVAKVFANAVRQYHPNKGSKDLEIKEPILVGATQTDFRPQINSLMNSNVEGFFNGLVGAGEISFFQQAHAVGLNKKLKAIAEVGGEFVAKSLGKSMPPSFWAPLYWPYQYEPVAKHKIGAALYKDAVALTKDPVPPALIGLGYRGAQALFEGVKKAKSTDNAAVIKAMEGLVYETFDGPYRLRKEDHQGLGRAYVGNFVATDKEPFFTVKNITPVVEENVVESPSPGAEYIM